MKKFLSGVLISLTVIVAATAAQADPASNATVGIHWHGNIP